MAPLTKTTGLSATLVALFVLTACDPKQQKSLQEEAELSDISFNQPQSHPSSDQYGRTTEMPPAVSPERANSRLAKADNDEVLSPVNDSVGHLEGPNKGISSTTANQGFSVPENHAPAFTVGSVEKYGEILDNRTIQSSSQPVSTFSIDVDTGAYANVRRFLNNGSLPAVDAVRIEEMLNYFTYSYSNTATRDQPFSIETEIGPSPWNANTRLLHIGLQGYTPVSQPASNLVFLIDVSGSMNSPDKLGLLKTSMSLLTRELDERDTVSIVVYAGSSGAVLEPTAGNEHRTIERALTRLNAGGSTNGAAGIELAYQLAEKHFKAGGTNRVILATDGDFNVGTSDTESLIRLIEHKRRAGVALTTLGFGTGNYNDHLMEQLADAGNGNYAYIDTLSEARKVLVDELGSTLLTIAKDVKIQIEFNPSTVSEYRLIGYSNRLLDNDDFNNDAIDAGEIGAGHSVTAIYEIALKGEGGERLIPNRYDIQKKKNGSGTLDEIAELRIRYKQPDADNSQLIRKIIPTQSIISDLQDTSDNYRFSASVASFGQLLRNNSRMEDFSFEMARNLGLDAKGEDRFGYRAEYLRLVDIAQSLVKLKRAATVSPDELDSTNDRG